MGFKTWLLAAAFGVVAAAPAFAADAPAEIKIGTLYAGSGQLASASKGLAAEPKLLVMDEPFSGLSPLMVSTVIHPLAQCRSGGLRRA